MSICPINGDVCTNVPNKFARDFSLLSCYGLRIDTQCGVIVVREEMASSQQNIRIYPLGTMNNHSIIHGNGAISCQETFPWTKVLAKKKL